MNVKEELKSVLAAPIGEAADAERAREAADLLAAYLRLDERAGRVLGTTEQGHSDAAGQDLRGVTLVEAAEQVLEEAGVPLHARELGARIKARGWRHPRSRNAHPDRIMFQLASRLPRQPDRFRRVAPNTFALTRWGEGGGSVQRRLPRFPLFAGPGEAIGREIGDSDAPVAAGEARWRS